MAQAKLENFRILIVGGGIAGLAAAIALRSQGRSILVLEQSSLNREIGATISLQPNASKIVEKQWGLQETLQEKGSMIDKGFQVYSTDGIQRSRVNLSTDEYEGDRVVYHRQDLHDALKIAATSLEREGEPATIRVDNKVISSDCSRGSVQLSDSSVLEGFDLIIAADGIHSKLRSSVLQKDAQPIPTGMSAYRMMIDTSLIEAEGDITSFMNPREPFTTMIIGHDRRLIMGPARNGNVYSVVALVPDRYMHEQSSNSSWTSKGDLQSLLESFQDFPDWCKRIFAHSEDIGLWQLHDIDSLDTWVNDRVILIGDASHAMLPTQGQGASQSIEDAEALGAFFADINTKPSKSEVLSRLQEVEAVRRPRASLIQYFSRISARPQGEKGQSTINIKSDEFMGFNCNYSGAKDWQMKFKEGQIYIPSLTGYGSGGKDSE